MNLTQYLPFRPSPSCVVRPQGFSSETIPPGPSRDFSPRDLFPHALQRKVLAMHELFRLLPAARKELDSMVPPRTSRVAAIHVRRTDKGSEAPFVPLSTYANILTQACDSCTVQLFSDETSVGPEFTALVTNKVWFRLAPAREPTRESFMALLLDIRLGVEADLFIGSPSSNLGTVICLLRAFEHCYSVEDRGFVWQRHTIRKYIPAYPYHPAEYRYRVAIGRTLGVACGITLGWIFFGLCFRLLLTYK